MLNCVIAVRPICLKIPSNLLHMELDLAQVHKIWLFKLLCLAVACTCSSNLNKVIKWLENHLNIYKRSNDPWNFPNFHMTVVLVHVKHRENFEGRKRKLSPVCQQTCIVPSRNHEPFCELLQFVWGVFPNFRPTGQFFYHIILVAWH